eukprot:7241214-Lingulodinium_polyedra.AAC.1
MPLRRFAAWLLQGGRGVCHFLLRQFLCVLAFAIEHRPRATQGSTDVLHAPLPEGPRRIRNVAPVVKKL